MADQTDTTDYIAAYATQMNQKSRIEISANLISVHTIIRFMTTKITQKALNLKLISVKHVQSNWLNAIKTEFEKKEYVSRCTSDKWNENVRR